MSGTHFDWTITLGNVVSMAGFVVTLVVLHQANIKRIQDATAAMARIETKLDALWAWWLTRGREE